jgi:hypothetical protein
MREEVQFILLIAALYAGYFYMEATEAERYERATIVYSLHSTTCYSVRALAEK